ncbi:helix-turn-helix domain-containing protein [Paenibacillus methanolicus]|uniref:DNA-binding XRE family transcriptional regulator n=1 Tax=Paenibacillus methanolicus TaxID=582686 RepID=A0A5S5BRS5_9BACL|nr:helix-turn-helix transcriptional regulator [Paenibacillus methanolicus]TYP68892.1 DNA-binding XRE family transcriptional regulator [Paenibacillus methanolicus]
MDKAQKLIVAKRIKEMRNRKGWTQLELAELLEVDRVSVTNYELGRAVPQWGTFVKLAELFNTTTDYLMGSSDDETKKTPDSMENEREFIGKIELTDEELMNQFEIDGRPLTPKEWKKLIELIRLDRRFED